MLAIVIIIIAHPISLSNEYMGSVAGAIVSIIVGMVISELLAYLVQNSLIYWRNFLERNKVTLFLSCDETVRYCVCT